MLEHRPSAILSRVPKRLVLVRRPDPRRVPRRLRMMGVVLLVAGVGAAGLVYWIETYRAEPSIEELLPGTTAANSRQVGLLYGHGVQSLWEVYQDLKQPGGQALMVAAVAGLAAAGCFRVAWLRDQPDDAP